MPAELLDGVISELLTARQSQLLQVEARDTCQRAQGLRGDGGAAEVQAAQSGALILEEPEQVPQRQHG